MRTAADRRPSATERGRRVRSAPLPFLCDRGTSGSSCPARCGRTEARASDAVSPARNAPLREARVANTGTAPEAPGRGPMIVLTARRGTCSARPATGTWDILLPEPPILTDPQRNAGEGTTPAPVPPDQDRGHRSACLVSVECGRPPGESLHTAPTKAAETPVLATGVQRCFRALPARSCDGSVFWSFRCRSDSFQDGMGGADGKGQTSSAREV